MELVKTIYVKLEKAREPEDDFLIASDDFTTLSELEETIEIGIYELKEKVNLVNETIIEEKGRKK